MKTPEGSDVYKNEFGRKGFDPGRGRIKSYLARFYKHAIPPGFKKFN